MKYLLANLKSPNIHWKLFAKGQEGTLIKKARPRPRKLLLQVSVIKFEVDLNEKHICKIKHILAQTLELDLD